MGRKSRIVLASLVSVILMSACGGGDQTSLAGKDSVAAACDPASGPSGTEITCDLPKGVDDSCILFFDNTPVKADFSENSFTFKAIGLAGNKDLVFRCGDHGEIPAGSFEIPVHNAEASSADDGATTADEEVITPSGTGPAPASVPTPPSTSDDGADPTPAAPAAPSALTATIKATKMFDTRLGLVKVDWTVTGGDDFSELYIYSGGFYRTLDDLSSKSNPCGKIEGDPYSSNGKRLLLVDSNGDDINEGSDIYEQWSSYLATARFCADGVCDGYTPPQGRILTGVPVCRMDLKDAKGAAVRSGTFYTRVLEEDSDFHLYAKTNSGEETTATTQAVAIDPVGLSVSLNVGSDNRVHVSATATNALRNLSISERAPAATNNLMNGMANALPGLNGIAGASSGCTSDSEVLQKNGDDNYGGSCSFKDKNTIVVSAVGIGAKNRMAKAFMINIDDLKKIELKDGGDHNCKGGSGSFGWSDCEGTLSLAVHVSAPSYSIKDQDGNVMDSGHTYAGLGEVELYSKPKDDKKTLIRSKPVDENGNVTFTGISRNHDHYNWQAKVGGVESNTTEKIDGLEPYKSSFYLDKESYSEDKLASAQKGVVCKAGGDLTGNITWHAEHLKDINVRCVGNLHEGTPGGAAGNEGTRDYSDDSCAKRTGFDKGSYDQQHGEVKMEADIGNINNSWKHTCNCDVTATAYDGTKYTGSFANWEYECSVH